MVAHHHNEYDHQQQQDGQRPQEELVKALLVPVVLSHEVELTLLSLSLSLLHDVASKRAAAMGRIVRSVLLMVVFLLVLIINITVNRIESCTVAITCRQERCMVVEVEDLNFGADVLLFLRRFAICDLVVEILFHFCCRVLIV